MNLTLVWFRKEWRHQRAALLAFELVAIVCIALGFLLAPVHWLHDESHRRLFVALFAMASIATGLLVLAPQLVHGEAAVRDGQLLQRLPGGLRSAWLGKLAFLFAVGALLPCVGFAAGELGLLAYGQPLVPLGKVLDRVDGMLPLLAAYAVLLPLAFANGWWMPSGRLATGVALLLALVLALAMNGVLYLHPGLGDALPLAPHVPWLVAIAIVVSWVSLRGRRGGDHRASARSGAVALIAALLPHAAWLGAQCWDYRHPDPSTAEVVQACGLSADGDVAVVSVRQRSEWCPSPFRIDLRSSACAQLGGPGAGAVPADLLRPMLYFPLPQRDVWLLTDGVGSEQLVDLARQQAFAIERDARHGALRAPAELRPALAAARRRLAAIELPDGGSAWIGDGALHVVTPRGEETLPWDESPALSVLPAGHGVLTFGANDRSVLFDLVARRRLVLPANGTASPDAVDVRGRWLVRATKEDGWLCLDAVSERCERIAALRTGDRLCGLLDDDRVLVSRESLRGAPATWQLFAYRPNDNVLAPIELPPDLSPRVVAATSPRPFGGPVRDPHGQRWLLVRDRFAFDRHHPDDDVGPPWHCALLRVDPTTQRATVAFSTRERELTLVGWQGNDAAIVDDGHRRLVRLDLATGAHTVLFPRAEGER